jgi:lysophospholipase
MNTTEKLQNVIRPWIDQNAVHEMLSSEDGLQLSTYHAVNPEEKAAVVMVHGFCGFFAKYHELFYNLYHAGYSVFFVELRGHGLSESSKKFDDRRVYVESFSEYVSDLNVMKKRAEELSKTGKLFLFGHSMGGCTAALDLEVHPGQFGCAYLSSPMLKMNYGTIPPQAVDAMAVYSKVVHNGDEYAPGQGPWTGTYEFENSSDDSEDRYRYQFEERMKNHMYQSWGGTWAWAAAAKDASRLVLEKADRCIIPVLIGQAGRDTMVLPQGELLFKLRSHSTSIVRYESSKHELFGSTDEVVEQYTKDMLTFFDAHL